MSCDEKAFTCEVSLWKLYWEKIDDRPQDLQDTVLYMVKNKIDKLFPSIFQVMQLTLMLPVSPASVERAHSSLKMIKTDNRSTMLQDRLSLFIWGFYVTFNTVQVISRRVVGRAEETSTYSLLGFCTVNCRPMASNYQLSHLQP